MGGGTPGGGSRLEASCPAYWGRLSSFIACVNCKGVLSNVTANPVTIGPLNIIVIPVFQGEETDEPVKHPKKKENICWHGKMIIFPSYRVKHNRPGSFNSGFLSDFVTSGNFTETSTIWNSETHMRADRGF